MTALAVVAAQTLWVSGPKDGDQVAGEAFTAGQMVYLSAAGTWLKAQCDGTAVEAGSLGLGMALFTADRASARGSIARPDAIVTVAASGLTVGIPYFVGNTAGALDPLGDLGSTDKVTFAGMTISATNIKLGYCYDSGAVLA